MTHTIVLRLLNSTLRGCEFELPPGRTLFLVTKQLAGSEAQVLPDFPSDTVFIPVEQGGVNFEILYDPTRSEPVTLRELTDTQSVERGLAWQQPHKIGSMTIALRQAT